jgi:hypothetical protein
VNLVQLSEALVLVAKAKALLRAVRGAQVYMALGAIQLGVAV